MTAQDGYVPRGFHAYHLHAATPAPPLEGTASTRSVRPAGFVCRCPAGPRLRFLSACGYAPGAVSYFGYGQIVLGTDTLFTRMRSGIYAELNSAPKNIKLLICKMIGYNQHLTQGATHYLPFALLAYPRPADLWLLLCCWD